MTATRSPLAGIRWQRTLVISLASIAIGGVVFARGVVPLMSAVASTSASKLEDEPFGRLMPQHAEELDRSQRRFNGRSFFFLPPAPPPPYRPPPPAPDPPPRVEPPSPPLPPPGPPANYGGPKEPYSMLGDLVFFNDQRHLRVGEEDAGVKVLKVDAPWSVTLAWSGGEYEVPVTFASTDAYLRNAIADSGETAGLLPPDRADEATAGLRSEGGSAGAAPLARGATRGSGTPSGRGRATPVPPARGAADGAPSAEVPPPLDEGALEAMSHAEIAEALKAITSARHRPDIDDATRERLNAEFEMLREIIRGRAS